MMRHIRNLRDTSPYTAIVVLLAFGALVLAFWPRAAELNLRDPQRRLYVKVENALSGNKIQIDTDDEADDGYVIYAGIRAPHRGEPLFEESLRRNAETVDGKTVRLRFGSQKYDKSGRMLAYVFADDVFVNEELVRDGLAYVRLTDGTRRFEKRLLAAQKEAMRHRSGIWHSRPVSRESHYPADPKYGNFHRPKCEECNKIKAERLVTFKSAARAIDAGFAPCSRCNP